MTRLLLLTAIVLFAVALLVLALWHRVEPDVETAPAPVEVIHKFAPPSTSTAAKAQPPAQRARTAPMHTASARPAPTVVDGAWSCGGDLPPCWVLNRENPNRDLTVYNGGAHHEPGYTGGNPEGDSTASGKWQFLRSTWNRFMGYVNAADAPWQVQDAKAREVWADGRGCRAWSAC